jgi:hypothetical protein
VALVIRVGTLKAYLGNGRSEDPGELLIDTKRSVVGVWDGRPFFCGDAQPKIAIRQFQPPQPKPLGKKQADKLAVGEEITPPQPSRFLCLHGNNRTSAASKAVHTREVYGTAEAVPFVLRLGCRKPG